MGQDYKAVIVHDSVLYASSGRDRTHSIGLRRLFEKND